jgi:hypothetical protein
MSEVKPETRVDTARQVAVKAAFGFYKVAWTAVTGLLIRTRAGNNSELVARFIGYLPTSYQLWGLFGVNEMRGR